MENPSEEKYTLLSERQRDVRLEVSTIRARRSRRNTQLRAQCASKEISIAHLHNDNCRDEDVMTHGISSYAGLAVSCLTDLEAYIPSAEDHFNSTIRELRDLNFPLLQELSTKKDASTQDIMDLLRLDDAVAETLGMTDLQPDASQLMVPSIISR
ncbi:hypothetical protein Tco_0944430 [Tanacetum coccineum]